MRRSLVSPYGTSLKQARLKRRRRRVDISPRMRRYLFLAAACFIIASPRPALAAEKLHNYVLVYCFHDDSPSTSYIKIAQYTRETLRKYFKRHLESGRIVFKEINVSDSWNNHYIAEYQLHTDALNPVHRSYVVAALISNDREVKYKRLTGIWENWYKREDFSAYLQAEVEQYLQETFLEPY